MGEKSAALRGGQLIAIPVSSASALTGENMMDKLCKLWLEDDGQDLAEYGLLLILIAVAVVTAIGLFKDQIVAAFSSATSALTGA
jgi:pilus assembly protein Flp/PilA